MSEYVHAPHRWRIARGRVIEFDPEAAPLLMAIVNATPDSFSDGGLHFDAHAGIERALRAIDEGAAIIDVGGESTRPGAARVGAAEQIRRVMPIVTGLRSRSDVPISVDTTLAAVAEAALDAGADVINDTSAGVDDPRLLRVVAERRAGVVLMHRRRLPSDEVYSHEMSASAAHERHAPRDVVSIVIDALSTRVRAATDAGVDPYAIVLDPGLGFGKSVDENFELLARLDELAVLDRPLLIGASRKSFIGHATGRQRPDERLAGSLAAAVLAAERGAALLRVHDVAAHREAMAVLDRSCRCRTSRTRKQAETAGARARIPAPDRAPGDTPWPAPQR